MHYISKTYYGGDAVKSDIQVGVRHMASIQFVRCNCLNPAASSHLIASLAITVCMGILATSRTLTLCCAMANGHTHTTHTYGANFR